MEDLLPDNIVVVEAWGEHRDVPLFKEEEVSLGNPVAKRRHEFTTARACARSALERLRVPPAPIPAGSRGEPCWPTGIVGSITHCDGYVACALGRAEDALAIGIDAEPHEPLPDGVLSAIALPEEISMLRGLSRVAPGACWDRLLFSAKESIYKAWSPVTGQWLGFGDVAVAIDAQRHDFRARFLVDAPPPMGGRPPVELHGKWLISEALVMAAVVLRR